MADAFENFYLKIWIYYYVPFRYKIIDENVYKRSRDDLEV